MRIEFHKTCIEVFREKGDKGYYGAKNAAGESNLFYDIKKHLNARGYDLIKKRMHKDGHTVKRYHLKQSANTANKPAKIWLRKMVSNGAVLSMRKYNE